MSVCRAAQQHGVDVAWRGMWACGRCVVAFSSRYSCGDGESESDCDCDSDGDGDGDAYWQSRAAQRSAEQQSRPACRMPDCFGRGAAA
jgi:hypothetical protein